MTLQQRLEARLAHLARQDGRIEAHLCAPLEEDTAEQALQVENDEVVASLHEKTRAEMAEIRLALKRMKAGTYGICDECGEPIPDDRLALVPTATSCIECSVVFQR
jgi:DnaK suppressor protein